MATDVPRLSADTSGAEVAAALVDHGVAIVERLVDAATVAAVHDELAPSMAATPPGADDFSGRSTTRTGGVLGRSATSVDLVAHPLVLDVCDRVLWPSKTTFQLHLTQAISIGPGSPAQQLHRDQWCFDFFPFPDDVQVEVSTMWALDDFTEANGATRVVPDSHGAVDPGAFGPDDTVPAEMPAGSLLLYTGRTVHGGGANATDRWRTGLNVDYVLGWLRQEENQYLSVPLDVVRGLPERVQELMGYTFGAYALGYVDDVRHPRELLRPVEGRGPRSFAPQS